MTDTPFVTQTQSTKNLNHDFHDFQWFNGATGFLDFIKILFQRPVTQLHFDKRPGYVLLFIVVKPAIENVNDVRIWGVLLAHGLECDEFSLSVNSVIPHFKRESLKVR